MKKLYIISLLGLLTYSNLFSQIISQVSSTCTDEINVEARLFSEDGEVYEYFDDVRIPTDTDVDSIHTVQIKIPGAEAIRIILEIPASGELFNNDVIKFYEKNSIERASYTNISTEYSDTVYINSNYATVTYFNASTDDSEFNISWLGLIPSTATLTHNCAITGNSGVATITSVGGIPDYDYKWGGGETENSIINLDEGKYYYTVTDENGCMAIDTVTIFRPTTVLSVDVDTIGACSSIDNGEISLLGKDGIKGSGYTYEWGDVTDITNIRTDLSNGPYFYTVTDSIGCFKSGTIDLERYSPISISEDNKSEYDIYQISCHGASDGFIKVSASGGSGAGYEYQWGANAFNQLSDSVSNLFEGIYSVDVIDDNGCTSMQAFIMDEPGELVIDSIVNDAKKIGEATGSIEITDLGDVVLVANLDWTGQDVTDDLWVQNDLYAGLYSLHVTDGNGCTVSANFEVGEPTSTDGGEIALHVLDSANVCYNDNGLIRFRNVIEAFSNGGVTYKWQYSAGGLWTDLTLKGTESISGDFDFPAIDTDTLTQTCFIRRYASKGSLEAPSNEIELRYFGEKDLKIYNIVDGDVFCENDDSINVIAVPYNSQSTFSGTNVVDNNNGTAYFKPHLINIGAQTVSTFTYYYNNAGCVTDTVVDVTIYPAPEPDFVLEDKYVNTTDSAHITGVVPPPGADGRGVFTGQTVIFDDTSANFYPYKLAVDNYDFVYEYTDINNCSASTTKSFSIIENTVSIYYNGSSNLDPIFCYDGDPINLTISSGSTIFNEHFIAADWVVVDLVNLDEAILYPENAIEESISSGVVEVKFEYQAVSGGAFIPVVEYVEIINITSEAEITDPTRNYCMGEGDVVMHANPLPATAIGAFSGLTEISGDDGEQCTISVNDMETIDFGNAPEKLIYTYTHTESGCKDTAQYPFPVYALPDVNLTTKDTFNIEETTYALNTYTPATNIEFIMDEVVSLIPAFYNPSLAGLGLDTIFMRHTYANTGCVNIDSNEVFVKEAHGTIKGLGDSIFCYKGDISKIYVDIPNRAAGGVFTISDHALAPEEVDGDTLFLDPSKYAPDDSCTISYTYDLVTQPTSFTISVKVYIDDIGQLSVSGIKDKNCEYDDEYAINGIVNSTLVSYGDFSCSEVALLNNGTSDDGTALFDPEEISVDSIWPTVTFTYQSRDVFRGNNSTCTDHVDTVIKIYDRPVITFTDPLKAIYNIDGPTDTIKVESTSGTFSGDGIVNTLLGIFDPSVPSTSNTSINYTYTDPKTTCTNFEEQSTNLQSAQGTFVDTEDKYCYEDSDYTISINNLNTGHNSGKFSGLGITDNGNWENATLNPETLYDDSDNTTDSVKTTITYTYYVLESADSARFVKTKDVYVRNLSDVTFDIPISESEVCRDGSPIQLTNMPSNLGGTFAMDSTPTVVLTGDNFIPLTASSGNNTILYTYTFDGCSVTKSNQIYVHEKPTITFPTPLLSIYNVDDLNDTIVANPTGGLYGGEAIENITLGIFNPSIPSGSTTSITYSYTDPSTTCSNVGTMQTELKSKQGVFENVQSKYCYSNEELGVSITGLDASSVDGFFSGDGIVDGGDGINAKLNPELVFDAKGSSTGEIESEIKYSYKIGKNNDTAYFDIVKLFKVNNVSNVTFVINDFMTDSVCRYSDPINLTNIPNTTGGEFFRESNGINIQILGGSFNPVTADSSVNIIQYVYDNGDCSIIVKDTIFIEEHPVAEFELVDNLCVNDSSIIIGYPRGGDFSGQSFTDLYNGIDSILTDSVKFYAGASFVNGDFTYTVQSEFGCETSITKQSSVFKNPESDISADFVDDYCINGSTVSIFGLDGRNQVSTGYFTGDGVVDESEDGQFEFNPTLYAAGDYKLKFHYTNANNCSDSIEKVFTINALPVVDILNIEKNNYCPNEPEISVNGSPAYSGGVNNGFHVNGVLFPTGSQVFNPSDYVEGSNVEFIYTHTDGNGCTNKDTVVVGINRLPKSAFIYDNSCIGEPTQFTYVGGTLIDSIQTFSWVFGDEENHSDQQNPSFNFENVRTYNVKLELTNIQNCMVSFDTNLVFDDGPIASFAWDLECEGSTVSLFNNSSKKTNVEFTWNIGGEEIQSNADTTNYEFNNSGQFEVTLLAQESVKCKDDTTQVLNIRPIVSFDNSIEYVNSFENDAYDGWAGITLDSVHAFSTWENALPSGTLINEASEGNKSWVTNASGSYDVFEESALTSPCFDLSQLKRPMISFDYWIETQNETDGAVLQYRVDGSDNWENIGDDENGINWYNHIAISSEPGESGEGWTGITEGWLEAKHDLDAQLIESELIQFRFAFAANQDRDMEGFAVDNFRIGERTRRVLVEHFTNTESSSASSANKAVNNMIGTKPLDVIDIQYHTALPEGDAFYNHYQTGPNVRANYYNLTKVPFGLIDGENEIDYSLSSTERTNLVLNRAMKKPEFAIEIESQVAGNTMTISNNIEALSEISNKQLQIISAVVEREVMLAGTNVVYENVLRHILPSASGEYLEKNWNIGDNQLYTFTYEIDDYVSNMNNLNVITFIQDEVSKEILQAATTDTTSSPYVSVDELFAHSEGLDMFIYPNPASKSVGVLLNKVVSERCEVQILNQQGRLISSEEVERGIQFKKFSIESLQEGVYFVKCLQGNKQVVKKLVIVK